MDSIITPSLITTALTKLLNSAAGEAGSKSWEALRALLARHHRSAPPQPATSEEAAVVAEQLASAAAHDDALAEDLLALQRSIDSDDVTNIVSGQVGRLVQGRDFTNTTITFT